MSIRKRDWEDAIPFVRYSSNNGYITSANSCGSCGGCSCAKVDIIKKETQKTVDQQRTSKPYQ